MASDWFGGRCSRGKGGFKEEKWAETKAQEKEAQGSRMSIQHRGMGVSVVHDASKGEAARECGQARHDSGRGDCTQRLRCGVVWVMKHAW